VSFNTRRIFALVVVLLGSTFGGLLAIALTDSRLAAIAGVVLGAVVGMVCILISLEECVEVVFSEVRMQHPPKPQSHTPRIAPIQWHLDKDLIRVQEGGIRTGIRLYLV
jgi:hypothetical protein